VGTAPDSWGVWFPDDPHQPPPDRFLDEVAALGYRWIELGPLGYLPADRYVLERELAERALRVAGTFVSFELEAPDGWFLAHREVDRTCRLLRHLGASNLIVIDGIATDLHTGERLAPRTLDAAGWARLVEAVKRVAETAERYGLTAAVHPHIDTHIESRDDVERLIDDMPEVRLCLDVGHFAFGGGDPIDFFRRHRERIVHVHLKSVDADIRDRVRRDGTPFCRAVAGGVFVEPSRGVVDFPALRDAFVDTGYDGVAIVEQDMYPAPFDAPLPIARRTRDYLTGIGLA
jgi:inosose dehydratase